MHSHNLARLGFERRACVMRLVGRHWEGTCAYGDIFCWTKRVRVCEASVYGGRSDYGGGCPSKGQCDGPGTGVRAARDCQGTSLYGLMRVQSLTSGSVHERAM